MFAGLELITADAILGLMAAFRADPDPRKVDLGVGVYRDDRGETPVLEAVRQAEEALVAQQTHQDLRGPDRQCRLQRRDGEARVRRRARGADRRARPQRADPRRLRRAAPRCGAHPPGRARQRRAREHAHLGQSHPAAGRQRAQARALSVFRSRHRRGAVRRHDERARAPAAARGGAAARLLPQPDRRGP